VKALIVGAGSIGKQHAKALTSLGVTCAFVSQRESEATRFISLEEGLSQFMPDSVVVANGTQEHYASVCLLASLGFRGSVLVEKPLFHDEMALPTHSFRKLGVGYQLRFHPALLHLREKLCGQTVLSVQAYVGQYLPTWRPGTDYRRSYSAQRRLGGGVLRDLSHELDYLQWLFGRAIKVTALGGKLSSLEIDSEDTIAILAQFERCPVVTVQLNYCDRIGRREIVVNADSDTYSVNLRTGEFLSSSGKVGFSLSTLELLMAEHRAFGSEADDNVCTADEGLQTVGLIKRIEEGL
jgi:predicted dehydrogenase